MREVFHPNAGKTSVLLLDSWSGHNTNAVANTVPEGKLILPKIIPKGMIARIMWGWLRPLKPLTTYYIFISIFFIGTTGQIQPLDVYGFRIWKNFVRNLSDSIQLLDAHIGLANRNNVIKLQSLTHNQLSSPRYKNLFKYAWYASGYVQERPMEFENPVDFSFKHNDKITCDFCESNTMLKCSWCRKILCANHFFIDFHYCEIYVE